MINCVALASITNIFLKDMLNRNSGSIIQISSTAGFCPGPYMANYYATKSYVNYLSRAIAHEIRDTKVKMTIICPGPVKTEFQAGSGAKIDVNKLKITTPDEIVEFSLKNSREGNVVAVHGFKFKMLIFLMRLAPQSTIVKIMSNMQIKRAKRYGVEN